MAAVTVIIPNWNGMEHLPTCLNSLMNQTFRDFEVIVVDNGSEDGSVAYIKQYFPQIRVIEFPENRGFCAAVNAGILAANTEYIALLNNDVEVDKDWLYYLYKAMNQHPEVGSCVSKVKDFYNRHRIIRAGDGMYKHFFPYPRRYKSYDDGPYDEEEYVFGATGAAAIYKRKMFDTIGLFDEDFFAYYDDVDLSFRAQLAGFKCLYVPKAVCYHKEGKTGSKLESFSRLKSYVRNQIWSLIKCVPLKLAFKYFPFIILAAISQNLKFAVKEKRTTAILVGYWEALKTSRRMYNKRKKIQQFKAVSDQYIESILTPYSLGKRIKGFLKF